MELNSKPLEAAPRDLDQITAQETSVVLPHFTADDAFEIGTSIRNRLKALSAKPAVVNITLANSNQLLYHAASNSGVLPANDIWVARKRKTVLRFGVSSWWMHNKLEGDEEKFAAKFLFGQSPWEYAIHGGGVPVKVSGVEGVVAVIVVSGLAQHEDHQVVVEAMQEFIRAQTEGKKTSNPVRR